MDVSDVMDNQERSVLLGICEHYGVLYMDWKALALVV